MNQVRQQNKTSDVLLLVMLALNGTGFDARSELVFGVLTNQVWSRLWLHAGKHWLKCNLGIHYCLMTSLLAKK